MGDKQTQGRGHIIGKVFRVGAQDKYRRSIVQVNGWVYGVQVSG